jgi:long-subunit fatty acid transport protein
MRNLLLALTGILFFSSPAHADTENPLLFPIGEREPFLGNTGIAGVHSIGAMHYNPAALTELNGTHLSVSGSAFLHYSIQADPYLKLDQEYINFKASGLTTIPTLTASSYEINPDTILAVGILVPESLLYNDHQFYETSSNRIDILSSENDQEMRVGTAVGVRMNPKFSLGASVFIVRNSNESQGSASLTSKTIANTSASTQTFESLAVYNLSMGLGTQYIASPEWKFGAVVKLPGVRLGGSANYFNFNQSIVAGVLSETRSSNPDAPAFQALPFDFGIGASFTPTQRLTLVADLSAQAGSDFIKVPGETIEERTSTYFRPRFNLGAAYTLNDDIGFSAGFLYNPSTIKDTTASNPLSKPQNFWGGSAGVDFRTGRTTTRLGVYYAKATAAGMLDQSPATSSVSILSALIGITYNL